MNVEKINKRSHKLRVLVAPLDWGLGHATRCIPIINVLNEHDIEVIIAAEGPVAKLLQNEYPDLSFLPLTGYRIKYSRRNRFFFLKMMLQFPRVLATVLHEKKWLKKMISLHKIDAVISDNRFGLHHANTPCIYVTHQLFIQTGNGFLNKIAQKINYYFINKFDECWVPDVAGPKNLAGKLSHPGHFPMKPVKYIGILSRFKKSITSKKYDLLVLLSGPEPQRTIFENYLLAQLKNIEGRIVLVRGLPDNGNKLNPANKNLAIHDHLPAAALNELIQQSENIIARCGYSTVMDLLTLKQKAILVPTPGQTEQEYLATYLLENKIFLTCPQERFSIKQMLEEARHFNFAQISDTESFCNEVIVEWIGRLGNPPGFL